MDTTSKERFRTFEDLEAYQVAREFRKVIEDSHQYHPDDNPDWLADLPL